MTEITIKGKNPSNRLVVNSDGSINTLGTTLVDGIAFGNYSQVATLRSDGQPDYIDRTSEDAVVYRKTYSYNASGFYTGETAWVQQ